MSEVQMQVKIGGFEYDVEFIDNWESHLRYFTNIEAVRDRYCKYIDIEVLEKFDKWYIIKGTIK